MDIVTHATIVRFVEFTFATTRFFVLVLLDDVAGNTYDSRDSKKFQQLPACLLGIQPIGNYFLNAGLADETAGPVAQRLAKILVEAVGTNQAESLRSHPTHLGRQISVKIKIQGIRIATLVALEVRNDV